MKQGAPGLLIVTHGRLADELEQAARRIIGDVPKLAAISLDWDDNQTAADRAGKWNCVVR